MNIGKEGDDFFLDLHSILSPDDPIYNRISFIKADKIEMEEGIKLDKHEGRDGQRYSNIVYLYEEIYKNESGYEVHFLLDVDNELKYMTIVAEDIVVEEVES